MRRVVAFCAVAVIAVGLAACGSGKPLPKRPFSASITAGQATIQNVATGAAKETPLPCKLKVPLSAAETKSAEAYIRKQILPRMQKGHMITAAEARQLCKLYSAK